MDDPGAGGHPLHVAVAKAGRGAQRIGVVDVPLAGQGDGLEAPVGVAREPGDHVPVIHAPAVPDLEVHADLAAGERRSRTHAVIARRVKVQVVHAEEERIGGHPGKA